MIVRNGADALAVCLESAAPLADEMVVVDTGSTDDSVAIARRRGARVVEVKWEDDFAKARNVYLEVARGSWVLSLDADEVLAPLDRETLIGTLQRHPDTAFLFSIRNYFVAKDGFGPALPSAIGGSASPGVRWSISRTIRLFPRHKGVRYRYPVHETLVPSLQAAGIRIRRATVPIHHMGYLHGQERLPEKASIYKTLALKKFAQYPRSFAARFELAKLCLHDKEFARAERLLGSCLRLNPFSVPAHYYLGLTLLRAGDVDRCRRQVRRALALLGKNDDLVYLAGLVELEAGDHTSAMLRFAPLITKGLAPDVPSRGADRVGSAPARAPRSPA